MAQTATISTFPKRRMPSECTLPMNPAPMTAVFSLRIVVSNVFPFGFWWFLATLYRNPLVNWYGSRDGLTGAVAIRFGLAEGAGFQPAGGARHGVYAECGIRRIFCARRLAPRFRPPTHGRVRNLTRHLLPLAGLDCSRRRFSDRRNHAESLR